VARRASYKTVELEVRRSNLAAQALYRSFKFEQVGMRARYYEDNDEDAILMTLRLRE
jgi:ribosomal-protein-alanine N-acetyltransferase